MQVPRLPEEEGWSGEGPCRQVIWERCRLVKKMVDFIVPHITCIDGQEVRKRKIKWSIKKIIKLLTTVAENILMVQLTDLVP